MADHAAPAVVCQSNDFPPTAAISPSTITRLFPVYCSGEHLFLLSTGSNGGVRYSFSNFDRNKVYVPLSLLFRLLGVL